MQTNVLTFILIHTQNTFVALTNTMKAFLRYLISQMNSTAFLILASVGRGTSHKSSTSMNGKQFTQYSSYLTSHILLPMKFNFHGLHQSNRLVSYKTHILTCFYLARMLHCNITNWVHYFQAIYYFNLFIHTTRHDSSNSVSVITSKVW